MKSIILHKEFFIALAAFAVLGGAFLYSPRDEEHRLSMQELLNAHTNAKCTFTSLSPKTDTDGVLFVSDQTLRGDFTSTMKSETGGRVIESHMIVDRDYSYIWTQPLSGVGIRVAVASMKALSTSGGDKMSSTVFDLDQKLAMNCEPWVKETSRFIRPRGVSFQDMSGTSVGPPSTFGTGTQPRLPLVPDPSPPSMPIR